MIGTIAAQKPTNPGKPDNKGPKPPTPPPKYWFYISIGQEGDDVVLVNPPITAISYVDTCGWNWPPKAKTKHGGWNADPHNYIDPDVGCGTYNVNLEAPGLPAWGVEADTYSISHYWSYQRVREFGNQPIDFWEFYLIWGHSETDPLDYSNLRWLRIHTDWGPELEGDYYPEGEVEEWIVDFNGAIWELLAFYEDGTGYIVDEGTIVNGFTVTIEKGDLVS